MRAIDLERFPNIAGRLAELGIDPRRETVPVAPAAHYTMGGVAAGLDCRATLPGLYAVGECACTGLHGANRLASNSLAECFVFGRRAALAACEEPDPGARTAPPPPAARAPEPPSPATREALWRQAGLRRDASGLRELARDPYPLAQLIAQACLAREESRGAHQRSDFPQPDPRLDGMHTLVRPGADTRLERWQ
jgi:L-aspartate oxidase